MEVFLVEVGVMDGTTTPYGVFATQDEAVRVAISLDVQGSDSWSITAFVIGEQEYGRWVTEHGPTRQELRDAGWRGY